MDTRYLTVALAGLAVAGAALLAWPAPDRDTPRAAPLPPVATATNGSTSTATSTPAGDASARRPGPLPPGTTPGRSAPPKSAPQPQPQQGLGKSQIRIPALGVTAIIGQSDVVNGVLTPPRVPNEVGLWTGSAALTATTGEVTIAGHVNWAGMAPFAFGQLAYLQVGELVYTTDASGVQSSWRVTDVRARTKQAGIDPAAFAGPAGPRLLTLVTCGGNFNAAISSYDDNVYVTAVPA